MNGARSRIVLVLLLAAGCTETVGPFGLDLVPPRLISITPSDGTVGHDLAGATVTVTFSEPVSATNPISVEADSGEVLSGTTLVSSNEIVWTTSDKLDYLTTFSITIACVQDLAGNEIEAVATAEFTTRDLTWSGTTAVSTTGSNPVYVGALSLQTSDDATYLSWGDLRAWVVRRPPAGPWETPLRLSTRQAANPVVATLASGGGAVVWQEKDASDTRFDVYARVHETGTWSPSVPLETSLVSSGEPVMASDREQRLIAIYEEFGSPARLRYAAFDTKSGWGNPYPVQLSYNSDSDYPGLSMSPDGFSVASWKQDLGGGQIGVLASLRGSGSPDWSSPPDTLHASTFNPSEIRVASRGSGTAVVVWAQSTAGEENILMSTFDGTSWSSPAVLSTAAGFNGTHCLASNEAGDALVVFRRGQEFYSAAVRDQDVVLEAVGTADADAVACFVDERGNGGFAWIEDNGIGEVRFRRYLQGVGWSQAVPAESDIDGSASTKSLAVACDPSGRAVVVWLRYPSTGGIYTTVWSSVFE